MISSNGYNNTKQGVPAVDDIQPAKKINPKPEGVRPKPTFRKISAERFAAAKTTKPTNPETAEPEQADATPAPLTTPTPEPAPMPTPTEPAKKGRNPFKKLAGVIAGFNKWQKAGLAAAVFLVFFGGGFGVFALLSDSSEPEPVAVVETEPEPEPEPEPITEASRLSGVQIDPTLNTRPVTAVIVENSLEARPQHGLAEAGVVFEAIAEGGVTRFMALYQDTQPTSIGPVRSVRPYYLDVAAAFDASIAHVGGSPQGLSELRALGLKDLDEFANSGGYFRSTDRFAPHNVFTTSALLDSLNTAKGFTTSDFTPWPRKEATPADERTITAQSITVSPSSFNYNSAYEYDETTNTYQRTMAGQPHTDGTTNAQIAPSTLIAMVTSRSQSGIYSVYQMTGSGEVFVFQDGGVTIGRWQKPSRTAGFSFVDTAGDPIALNPGQTWLSVVSSGGQVNYSAPAPEPAPAVQ